MKFLPLCVLSLLLFAWPGPGRTADLYSGEATVQNQSESERRAAMPRALAEVLGKHSGLRQLPPAAGLDGALAQAPGLALAFAYRTVAVGDGQQLRLVASFSPQGVDQLVRELGLPLWPPRRPPLMAWIVVDEGFGRQLQPAEWQDAWVRLADVAARRGLDLVFPGPEAAESVDLQLLWGGFTEQLLLSHPESRPLIAAARRDGAQWQLRMASDIDGRQWSQQYSGTDLAGLLEQGLQQAIDEVAAAARIAPDEQGQTTHAIAVAGLSDGSAYLAMIAYLEALSVVDHVDVRRAQAGRVELQLQLNAAPDVLERVLAAEGRLQRASGGEYQWLP